MSEITLENVTKRYGDIVAIDDVSVTIRDGELLVLVGPSGCGKTSLLRIIAGLEEPTEGEVYIDGTRITEMPARKRDVAFVFQEFALFPHLDVRQNVAFNLRMRGGYDDLDGRVERTAELLEIEDLLDRAVSDLSGGQQQRVALGRAIASEPRAFLLDEPLANLDAQLRNQMQTEIARLQRRLGVTTVHVTHNQAEAMTMGDQVAVLADGRLQQVGTPEAVYNRPATRFVARFIGNPPMNLLTATYDATIGVVELEGTDAVIPLRVPDNQSGVTPSEVLVGVRPESVAIHPNPSDKSGWFSAVAEFVEFHGADRYVYLQTGGIPDIVARVGADTDIGPGNTVGVSFAPERIHLFHPGFGDRIPVEAPDDPRQ